MGRSLSVLEFVRFLRWGKRQEDLEEKSVLNGEKSETLGGNNSSFPTSVSTANPKNHRTEPIALASVEVLNRNFAKDEMK